MISATFTVFHEVADTDPHRVVGRTNALRPHSFRETVLAGPFTYRPYRKLLLGVSLVLGMNAGLPLAAQTAGPQAWNVEATTVHAPRG